MQNSGSTNEILTKYYDALSRKEGWQSLLSDNFLLTGTVAQETRGRDAYVNNAFWKLVKGLKVREMIVEGERAFAIVNYALVSPTGKSFSADVAEFWKLKNGKLDSIAIYFDTAAFSKFMA
jgi:ketosteroid isomerase-like protein